METRNARLAIAIGVLLIIAFLIMGISTAKAQDVSAIANTNVQSGALSGSDASNQGNAFTSTNNFGASDGVRYSGHYSVHANPGTSNGGAAAGFSNDNCGNTGQKSVSAMIASGATMYTIESVPCNLRASARLGYQIADTYDAKGQPDVADKIRGMSVLAWCESLQEADANALHNCHELTLIADGKNGRVNKPATVTYYRTPEAIPSRPAGTLWKDGKQVDERKAPATRESGWVEPARNP